MIRTLSLRANALIGLAHRHLDAAADTARFAAPDSITGDGFAGQIRLAADTLPLVDEALADEPTLPAGDVADHLRHALDTLDQIPPLEGPTDLPLCAWHVHELLRMATDVGAA